MSARGERMTHRKGAKAQADLLAAPTSRLGNQVTHDFRESLTPYERRCAAKLTFRSRAAVAKWIKAHPRAGDMVKVYPYECPQCGDWHTSSSRPR